MIFLKIIKIIVSPTDNIVRPYERIDIVKRIKGIDKRIPDKVSIDVKVDEFPFTEKLGNAEKIRPENLINMLIINSNNSLADVNEPNKSFSRLIFIVEWLLVIHSLFTNDEAYAIIFIKFEPIK